MGDSIDLIEISLTLMIVFWVFGFLSIISESSQRVTDQFVAFGEELERCDWLMLSKKMQGMYLIFLSNIQQKTYIKCYGNILCSRETFKKVNLIGFSRPVHHNRFPLQTIKTGFSYFTSLRRLEM